MATSSMPPSPSVVLFLQRINLPSSPLPPPSLHTLNAVVKAFLYTVPFENLDIHLEQPVELEVGIEQLFSKIVTRRRGGVCFETNTLMCWALKQLGFTASLIFANVAKPSSWTGRTHFMIEVDIDSKVYVVDVGFGEPAVGALELCLDQPQTVRDGGYQHRFVKDDDGNDDDGSSGGPVDGARVVEDEEKAGTTLPSLDKAKTVILERWDVPSQNWVRRNRLHIRQPISVPSDLMGTAEYVQRGELSWFNKTVVCCKLEPGVRKTLSSNRFIIVTTPDQSRTERLLKDEEEFYKLLSEVYGVRLGSSRVAQKMFASEHRRAPLLS